MQDLHVVLYGADLFQIAEVEDTSDEVDIADLFYRASNARGYEYQNHRSPFLWQTKRVNTTDSLIAPDQSNPLHLELSIPQSTHPPVNEITEVLSVLDPALNQTRLDGISFHLEIFANWMPKSSLDSLGTVAAPMVQAADWQDVVLTFAPTSINDRQPQINTAHFTRVLNQVGAQLLR